MLKLSKKIALPLIAVLLIGTGVGGYFLFKNFQIPKYFVDRYPELIEYCDTQESENGLKVSCKALMLDIKPNVSNGTPSLTSLVINNDEELKEYIITEKEDVFAWTNDVLQYKKLKPIIINLQYVKKNPIRYSLQGITFENIPDTYIQEIVNRDIEEIMGMDKSSTTILNSFDFCPKPETLPDYVNKKEEYTKYWNENILSETEYKNGYNYSLDDTTIRLLFACDSAKNVGYTEICEKEGTIVKNLLSQNLVTLNTIPNWDRELTESDKGFLKEISLIYDNMFLMKKYVRLSSTSLETLPNRLNSTSIHKEVLCGTYKILKTIGNENEQNYIKNIFSSNTTALQSTLCDESIYNGEFDSTGLYLKYRYSNISVIMGIYAKCNNLNTFILN